MKNLTPTSYALLGLLARRPWSAYELNAHMQYSVLSAFWPRAASGVYTEPKKLVANKLATARQEGNGRVRTVYSITAAGRRELLKWLSRPTETYVSMSFEAMLKFLYSESGNAQTLNDVIDAIEQSALMQARAVLEGVRPMPEIPMEDSPGMPYNGMALHFLTDVIDAQIKWAREARGALKQYADTTPGGKSHEDGKASYRKLIRRLEKIVD